jgi:hypothetical protein
VDDADAIERVRTDTWRDAYRGLLPDSLLDGLGYDGTRRRAVMAAMPPEQFVLVAEEDGRLRDLLRRARSAHAKQPAKAKPSRMSFLSITAAARVARSWRRRPWNSSVASALLLRRARKRTRQAAGEGEAEPYERMGGVHVRDEERELDGVRMNESGYGWEDISRSLGGSSGSVQRM